MEYRKFLQTKTISKHQVGFEPTFMPDFLYPFQIHLTDWAIRRGRGALFEDCGLGKTPQSLVWSQNVLERENRPILILTPLAVSQQFLREGEKFGIEVHNARGGRWTRGINVVNYEQLDHFDPDDFAGVVCDESSILKAFDGKMRQKITDFLLGVKYRLLGTATPAPNDYMELGTSSEALGEMGRNQMLGMFFSHRGDSTQQWELKGHARKAYWQWVAGWARAIRKPSDFGYEDGEFLLPPINVVEHEIPSKVSSNGRDCFFWYARTLDEQRQEKRESLRERCEKVAELIPVDRPAVVWCHYNAEADLLERIIPDAVQVAGRHSESLKEERMMGFSDGQIRVLVTKPRIAGFGMNWQHCSDVFCFPSHSYEQYYQTVRRCWRFGQTRQVTVNIVATQGEKLIMKNMLRKERAAIDLFSGIIREMRNYQVRPEIELGKDQSVELPEWL